MTAAPSVRRPLVRPAPPAPASRPDASMDLLLQIIRQPVDPDYADAAARGAASSPRHWGLAVVALVVGAMFAVGAVQTSRAAPALESERADLIARLQAAETRQDALRGQVTALEEENARLRDAALGGDATSRALAERIEALAPVVGASAVSGPGVQVTVDDATSLTGAEEAGDRVLDLDLQILANGLWQAGAEAVAINGHRLSSLTAIRSAGDAITVDYRSLTRPYRVEAVGDPRTLPAALAETAAGAWWHDLQQNRGIEYELVEADELVLSPDPGLTLRWAGAPS